MEANLHQRIKALEEQVLREKKKCNAQLKRRIKEVRKRKVLEKTLADIRAQPELLSMYIAEEEKELSSSEDSVEHGITDIQVGRLELDKRLAALDRGVADKEQIERLQDLQDTLDAREDLLEQMHESDNSEHSSEGEDENEDICRDCQDGGCLVACDKCPFAYHYECVGTTEADLEKIESWHCGLAGRDCQVPPAMGEYSVHFKNVVRAMEGFDDSQFQKITEELEKSGKLVKADHGYGMLKDACTDAYLKRKEDAKKKLDEKEWTRQYGQGYEHRKCRKRKDEMSEQKQKPKKKKHVIVPTRVEPNEFDAIFGDGSELLQQGLDDDVISEEDRVSLKKDNVKVGLKESSQDQSSPSGGEDDTNNSLPEVKGDSKSDQNILMELDVNNNRSHPTVLKESSLDRNGNIEREKVSPKERNSDGSCHGSKMKSASSQKSQKDLEGRFIRFTSQGETFVAEIVEITDQEFGCRIRYHQVKDNRKIIGMDEFEDFGMDEFEDSVKIETNPSGMVLCDQFNQKLPFFVLEESPEKGKKTEGTETQLERQNHGPKTKDVDTKGTNEETFMIKPKKPALSCLLQSLPAGLWDDEYFPPVDKKRLKETRERKKRRQRKSQQKDRHKAKQKKKKTEKKKIEVENIIDLCSSDSESFFLSGHQRHEDSIRNKSPTKRRNIKTVMKDSELDETTRVTLLEEEARKKRIQERKKQRQESVLSQGNSEDDTRIVLNPNRSESVAPLHVAPEIARCLKEHQVEGIQFMYENIIESMEIFRKGGKGGGCILSHLMGLGKTVQAIAFIECFLRYELGTRVVVVTPVNVTENWIKEIDKWIPNKTYIREVYNMQRVGRTPEARLKEIKLWEEEGGVLLIGFEMYVNLCMPGRRAKKKTMGESTDEKIQHERDVRNEEFKRLLLQVTDMIVLDEGHRIKNDKADLGCLLKSLETKRRVVLTGTPMQNNLEEYYHMIEFVRPSTLSTIKAFRNQFVNPIKNGQCHDSDKSDKRRMKRRVYVLNKRTAGFIHRRGYKHIAGQMPRKFEYTIFVKMTALQKLLYREFLKQRSGSLFRAYHALNKVWNHPFILLRSKREKRIALKRKQEKQAKKLIREQKTVASSKLNEGLKTYSAEIKSNLTSSSNTTPVPSAPSKAFGSIHQMSAGAPTSASSTQPISSNQPVSSNLSIATTQPSDKMIIEPHKEQDPEKHQASMTIIESNEINRCTSLHDQAGRAWFEDVLEIQADLDDVKQSGKLHLTLQIVDQVTSNGDKILVFSQSLKVLDIVEEKLQKNKGFQDGVNYFRLDGKILGHRRQVMIDRFNKPEEKQLNVFLISTKAGGVGINLIGANHAIIYDVGWNPADNLQAVYRIFRFGQLKPTCHIYRLVASGTMEQWIYERCLNKEGMALRVVDKKQIQGHFQQGDLDRLFRTSFDSDTENEDDDEEVEGDEPRIKKMSATVDKIPQIEIMQSVYNPYDQKRVEIPPDSLMWWLLAHFGGETEAREARKALEGRDKYFKVQDKERLEWIKGFHAPQSLLEHVEADALTEEDKKQALIDFEHQRIAIGNGALPVSSTSTSLPAGYPPADWPRNSMVEAIAKWKRKEIEKFLVHIKLSTISHNVLSKILTGEHLLRLNESLIRDWLLITQPAYIARLLWGIYKYVLYKSSATYWDVEERLEQGSIVFKNKVTGVTQMGLPRELLWDLWDYWGNRSDGGRLTRSGDSVLH